MYFYFYRGVYMYIEVLKNAMGNIFSLALHVLNSNTFPKPLSYEKEQEYFKKMSEGDIDAKNKLIEHNLRLVTHIIKKYYSTASDHDDLVSIGTIGLIKAVTTFDYTKGTKFATYASRCIENEILMTFRKKKKENGNVLLNDPIDTDSEGNSLTLLDTITENDDILDNYINKTMTENLYVAINKKLTGREKNIIMLRYGLNDSAPLTQMEVAQKLDISRSYVSRIEKKALLKLREEFAQW